LRKYKRRLKGKFASFKSCPKGECLATKHDQTLFTDYTDVDVLPSGQMVSNTFGHRPNEQNVSQCFVKCLSSLKCYQTRSNKALKQEMFGTETTFDRV